jgi:hypothetical protein
MLKRRKRIGVGIFMLSSDSIKHWDELIQTGLN